MNNPSGKTPLSPRKRAVWQGLKLARRRSLPDRLVALRAQYGDVVRISSFPAPTYLISHPEGVQHILRNNAGNYRKGAFFRSIALLQGQGLLTSEGEDWQAQRRTAQPAFRHPDQASAHGAITTEEARDMAERWREVARSGQPVNVAAWMHRLTFRVAGRALLGIAPDDLDGIGRQLQGVGRQLRPLLASGLTRAWALPVWLPALRRRRFRHAIAGYNAIVQRLIDRRRAAGQGDRCRGVNLLDLLMAAAEDGKRRDQQLRDQVMTFIGAGVETAAQALSWTWYLLARHAEAADRLQAELDTVLGGSPPEPAALPRLSYTRMVLDEVLRLYPPAAVIPRQANAADNLGGFGIGKNARVLISPYVTHRHEAFWADPTEFKPERFTPGQEVVRHRFAYLPFGAGPRVCIGQHLALMEMHLALATLAQRYTLHLIPGRTVVPEMTTTLGPRGGLWMTVHERG